MANATARLNDAAATAEFCELQRHVEEVAEQLQRLAQCVQESSHETKGYHPMRSLVIDDEFVALNKMVGILETLGKM